MTVLEASDTSAYDVLGVSPDASAQEIHAAFHWLIKRGGYRIGVPLRGRWLRAHQIKEAFATLGDPAKRRAYDESLEGASERTPWSAAPHDDPGLAALLSALSEGQPLPEPTDKSTTAAFSFGNGEREHAPDQTIESGNDDIIPAVDQPATSPGDEPEHAPAGAIESGSDEIVPSVDQRPTSPGDELEHAPVGALESGNDEIVQDLDQVATWPGEDSSRDGVKYGSAKLWGGAAAAALALGSLFYLTWPSGTPRLPGTEIAAQPPAGPQQVTSGAPTTGPLAKLPPPAGPDELLAKAPPDGLGDTPVPDRIANETQTGTGADAVSGGKVASATEHPLAPIPSGQASTAAVAPAAAAAAPPLAQAPSAAPPPPAAAAPQNGTSVAVGSGGSEVSSPAKLIGGGPTKLDNPRGRYVGSVIVQFTVQADGRVSNCGPVRSSGNADLDALTCRLVEERMRFNPALDAQGNPVASTAHARYEWGRRPRYPSLMSWMFRRPR